MKLLEVRIPQTQAETGGSDPDRVTAITEN
jgi:hypothetical protein